jgi:hypothetical protein
VTKASPPVLGFNNNVRHRGRVFHIQTEDSGVKNPRIVTHLFADGGRIIKTIRTEYVEHLERVDLANVVRQLMKAQHKAMFMALRAGDLDALLESLCGPLPLPPSRDSGTLAVASEPGAIEPGRAEGDAAPSRPRPMPAPALRNVEAQPSVSASESQKLPAITLEPPAIMESASLAPLKTDPARARSSSPTASRKPRTPASPATLSRPSSRYGSVPTKSAQSIFGDGVISEKSLDEVILSYLADDLDGPNE